MRPSWRRNPFAKSSKLRASDRPMGVVDEVELAFCPRSRLATELGFILGGVIPVATYLEAHFDLDGSRPLQIQAATFLVAGGLLFSAKTVFAWGKRAFRDGWKAAGFVVLLEGVMITSNVPVLPLVLLAILVAINGIAIGCALSLDRAKPQPFPPLRSVPAETIDPMTAVIGVSVSRGQSDCPGRAEELERAKPPRKRLGANSSQAHFSFNVAG